MKKKPILLTLILALLLSLAVPGAAFAAEEEPPAEEEGVYVLMNVPYAEFYEAEGAVDAISSATLNGKARNVNVNGASYHQSEEAVTTEGIAGVTYPVYALRSDLETLGGTEITDESVVSYELNARGQITPVTLEGAAALQEAPSYSYYVLSEAPAAYKELTLEDGNPVFAAVSGEPASGTVTGEVTVGAHHADIEISLSGIEVDPKAVSAVTVTADEETYALHHVVNIWRGTEIGWNLSDLDLGGKTVTNVRYYLKDGSIKDYATELAIEDVAYVLMNIPYGDFYANENAVDAITSATLNGKARNVNVNGASYHQSEEAVTSEGIAGVMYPVFAAKSDLAALGGTEITDESLVTYELNARGQITPVELKGVEALQEAPNYSYYVLNEKPASSKKLTVEEGKAVFAAAGGRAATGEATGEVTVGARHADIEISLSGVEVEAKDVSAVVITAGEERYALHHVVNIWRGTEIGWNLSDLDLGGKTVTNVRYYLKDGSIKDYATELNISQAGYVLMNIPYEAFYAAELGENGSVDAVSGATLKYANSGIAGGSYHETDAAEGAEVEALGATFPVFVPDLSLLDESLQVTDETVKTIGIVSGREKTITPTEVSGKDALFCAPSYSWYALSEKPARYKTLSAAEDGSFAFSAVSGRASAVADVTGSVSYNTHHGNFVEIQLNGVSIDEAVNGVVVSFADGSETALPVIQGFWQKTQLGWPEAEDAAGKTITGVRFITAENVYNCAVEIPIKLQTGEVTAAFNSSTEIELKGLPEDAENPVATVQTQVGRGETPTVIAENVNVENGVITTSTEAEEGVTYVINVVTDNYADLSLTAVYTNSTPAAPAFPGGRRPNQTVKEPEQKEETKRFEDVTDESAYYYAPVYWAVEKGVAAGKSETRFDPDGSATRAEMVTFLWRAAGSPEPKGTAQPFLDVTGGSYYEKAVLWAWENGITLGVDETHFAPDVTVTRGQALTFLFRALKIGSATGETRFEDVAEGAYYYEPVLWAVQNALTTGVDETHFAPMNACKRADIVTFLYRFYSGN